MASVVYLHVLNSGHFAFSGVSGFSSRISTYLLRGMVFSPSGCLLVCRADLDKLGLGGNLGLYVRVQLRGIAIRVGASVGIPAHIGEEQFVVSGALGAIDAASCGGDKLRVAFVERCLFQEQENVMLNPLLQVPHREQNALGFGSGSVPILAEAIGKCLFLLCWLQFGE